MPGLKAGPAGEQGEVIAASAPEDLVCYVNGKRRTLPFGKAETTLLMWLRGGLLSHSCSASCKPSSQQCSFLFSAQGAHKEPALGCSVRTEACGLQRLGSLAPSWAVARAGAEPAPSWCPPGRRAGCSTAPSTPAWHRCTLSWALTWSLWKVRARAGPYSSEVCPQQLKYPLLQIQVTGMTGQCKL